MQEKIQKLNDMISAYIIQEQTFPFKDTDIQNEDENTVSLDVEDGFFQKLIEEFGTPEEVDLVLGEYLNIVLKEVVDNFNTQHDNEVDFESVKLTPNS